MDPDHRWRMEITQQLADQRSDAVWFHTRQLQKTGKQLLNWFLLWSWGAITETRASFVLSSDHRGDKFRKAPSPRGLKQTKNPLIQTQSLQYFVKVETTTNDIRNACSCINLYYILTKKYMFFLESFPNWTSFSRILKRFRHVWITGALKNLLKVLNVLQSPMDPDHCWRMEITQQLADQRSDAVGFTPDNCKKQEKQLLNWLLLWSWGAITETRASFVLSSDHRGERFRKAPSPRGLKQTRNQLIRTQSLQYFAKVGTTTNDIRNACSCTK